VILTSANHAAVTADALNTHRRRRIGEDHELEEGDVVKIVSTAN
jgi:ribosome-interacting GTPase 1